MNNLTNVPTSQLEADLKVLEAELKARKLRNRVLHWRQRGRKVRTDFHRSIPLINELLDNWEQDPYHHGHGTNIKVTVTSDAGTWEYWRE
jgi:hypothetical protein